MNMRAFLGRVALLLMLALGACSAGDATSQRTGPTEAHRLARTPTTVAVTSITASTKTAPTASLAAVCAVYCEQLEWLRDRPPCDRTCTALMEDAAIGFPDKIRTSAQEGGVELQDWPDLNLALSAYESAIEKFPLDDCRRPVLSREINRCSRAAETVQYFAGQVHLALN